MNKTFTEKKKQLKMTLIMMILITLQLIWGLKKRKKIKCFIQWHQRKRKQYFGEIWKSWGATLSGVTSHEVVLNFPPREALTTQASVHIPLHTCAGFSCVYKQDTEKAGSPVNHNDCSQTRSICMREFSTFPDQFHTQRRQERDRDRRTNMLKKESESWNEETFLTILLAQESN